jgi:hypothetical protein
MREPIRSSGAFLIEHADIPPELTIAQWRELRAREQLAARAAAKRAARARRRARLARLVALGGRRRRRTVAAREVRDG